MNIGKAQAVFEQIKAINIVRLKNFRRFGLYWRWRHITESKKIQSWRHSGGYLSVLWR